MHAKTPTAAVRDALERHVADHPGQPVVIGCSGGPDSLALVHLAVSQRDVASLAPIHACVIDHGLQPGSTAIASAAVEAALRLGADAAHVVSVTVTPVGAGLEAAARLARRTALAEYATACAAPRVWLAHTLDDQAETVLLGLARGSGARSLAGMRADDGTWLRPLLECRRRDVHSCLPSDIAVWLDPHNEDPQFLRARVRHELMPAVASVLGDKAISALSRSAHLLYQDDEALSAIADVELGRVQLAASAADIVLDRDQLRLMLPAVMHRVFRLALAQVGCVMSDLTSEHLQRIAAATCGSAAVGPLAMPGSISVIARGPRLTFTRLPADS